MVPSGPVVVLMSWSVQQHVPQPTTLPPLCPMPCEPPIHHELLAPLAVPSVFSLHFQTAPPSSIHEFLQHIIWPYVTIQLAFRFHGTVQLALHSTAPCTTIFSVAGGELGRCGVFVICVFVAR
uniref:Uncharacterized protein n=1 Tax=Arundo donax TaxID=35708 RepID=A0A0A8ZY45_ARUDO